jgi:hypothetical protein
VSLGGCVDQTIHADTAHIFSHVQVSLLIASCLPHRLQLPAHYVNLFLYSVAPLTEKREKAVGPSHTGESTVDEGLLCGCCDLRSVLLVSSYSLLTGRAKDWSNRIYRWVT